MPRRDQNRSQLPDDVLRAINDLVGSVDASDPAALGLFSALARRPPAEQRPLHPRREEVATFRVRVDLKGAKPPIWRRVDLASDLTLDVVHQVLQAAVGWTDSHLHRFASGGGPFDPEARAFASDLDLDEGGDEDMTPERDVHLDEVLAAPGDVLHYTYDFGDGWEHTLRLEEVRPRSDSRAVVVTGRRACPPEDVGGVWGYEELLAARDAAALGEDLDDDDAMRLEAVGDIDPAAFDVAEARRSVDIALGALAVLGGPGGPGSPGSPGGPGGGSSVPDLVRELLTRAVGPGRTAVAALVTDARLTDGPHGPHGPDAHAALADLDDTAVASAVQPWRTLLRLVGPEGTPLTAAGWLKPDVVVALREVVDPAHEWIGKGNREDLTVPVADFRADAVQLKLVRRLKGRLVLTPAGRRAADDPRALLVHLLVQLPLGTGAEHDAGVLALLALAGGRSPVEQAAPALAAGLDALGWSTGGGCPIRGNDLRWVARPTLDALRHLGALVDQRRADRSGREVVVGPHGPLLARLALQLTR